MPICVEEGKLLNFNYELSLLIIEGRAGCSAGRECKIWYLIISKEIDAHHSKEIDAQLEKTLPNLRNRCNFFSSLRWINVVTAISCVEVLFLKFGSAACNYFLFHMIASSNLFFYSV